MAQDNRPLKHMKLVGASPQVFQCAPACALSPKRPSSHFLAHLDRQVSTDVRVHAHDALTRVCVLAVHIACPAEEPPLTGALCEERCGAWACARRQAAPCTLAGTAWPASHRKTSSRARVAELLTPALQARLQLCPARSRYQDHSAAHSSTQRSSIRLLTAGLCSWTQVA